MQPLLRRFLLLIALAAGATTVHDAAAQVRSRGWLGIAMDTGSASASGGAQGGSANSVAPPGVRISHIVRSSPADKAGFHEGERLLKVEGAAVASAREVIRLLGVRSEGDVVSITVSRAGKEQTVSVTLGSFPSPDEMLRMDRVGAFAPAFAGLEPMSGFPGSLSTLRGRVVLVDFWATWCGPCRIISPVLSGWQAKYGAQGLSVVGITTDSADTAAAYKERVEMRYPIASDPRAETSRAYDVSALPTVFIIDKRGVVRDVSVGYDPGRDLQVEGLIKTLLAEPAPAN